MMSGRPVFLVVRVRSLVPKCIGLNVRHQIKWHRFPFELTEYEAHLLFVVKQRFWHAASAVSKCPPFDFLSFQQNGLPPSEVDIGRRQVVQTFVITLVIVVANELIDLRVKVAR